MENDNHSNGTDKLLVILYFLFIWAGASASGLIRLGVSELVRLLAEQLKETVEG